MRHVLGSVVICLATALEAIAQECTPASTVTADVAAIDQAWVWNRYGALQPHGMMYALTRDLWVRKEGVARPPGAGESLEPGHVALRPDKRPRPLVLRVNRGQCLAVTFRNLLDSGPQDRFKLPRPEHARCDAGSTDEGCGEQPRERQVGFHPNGLEPVTPASLSSHVGGANPSSLIAPGQTSKLLFRAAHEGTYFAYSPSALVGGDGDGGSIFAGLFGAVHVEPAGSTWYRSQVTAADLTTAMTGTASTGHPLLDYDRLRILQGNEIIHSDLTAVIDTRKADFEPGGTGSCVDGPSLNRLPVCNDPRKPFREFTVIFHDESGAVQAYDEFDAARQGCDETDTSAQCEAARVTEKILHSVRDGFAINYGTAGAGAEVLANRKGQGPVRDCPECMVEEFFLTSWAVGDPAMVVDLPANMQASGSRASGTYFPDDPSNVYHSYLNDRLVFRNLHAGPKEHHVFHLHAHQWLQTQHDPATAYLDSQTIGPGGTYTYEIAYGGSGNRNRTTGDSIFHCHFYPHFAQGMWALWRVHDVFESGTALDSAAWTRFLAVPIKGARALPDGEILAGSPIPGIVPLPDAALAPLPGGVAIVNGQVTRTDDRYPGFPFFVPGVAGHRPPTPPLDTIADGGLQRHVVEKGVATADPLVSGTGRSLGKHWTSLTPKYVAENGTTDEQQAISFHGTPTHATVTTSGAPALFATNGLPGARGAPLADPCVPGAPLKTFQAAAFEFDMIFNKKGWHTPQARILALKDDVLPTMRGDRPPQPFLFRVSSGDCVEFQHSNIVPAFWKQDAFQVKTPTDIISQHIHLVKFDVIASDGGGNGFNYEDGTFSHEEVQHRIDAIRAANGCAAGDGPSLSCPIAQPHPWFSATPAMAEKYKGGRITAQRWYADPQIMLVPGGTPGCAGPGSCEVDKTLETVFTHDHFGPSTHQQAGLYAGLIVEPKGTRWFDTETLTELGVGRGDGGPTSWKALVIDPKGPDSRNTFREFGLMYQDFHIAYKRSREAMSTSGAINAPGQVAVDDPPATPNTLVKWDDKCATFPHCPEAVSADDIGVMSINYRSEPLPLRLLSSGTTQAMGVQGDLAHVFRSIPRADGDLNDAQSSYPLVGGVSKPTWPVLTPGMRATDPFTPLLEVYNEERFRVRMLAGAHEHEHSFTLNGVHWQFMPHDPNSGLRNFVTTALSEHHEIDGLLRIPDAVAPQNDRRTRFDHLFKIGASVDDMWYGNWGLLRAYRPRQPLTHLPTLASATQKIGGTAPARQARVRSAFEKQYLSVWRVLSPGEAREAAAVLKRAQATLTGPANERRLSTLALPESQPAAAAAQTSTAAQALAEDSANTAETIDALAARLSQQSGEATRWNYASAAQLQQAIAPWLVPGRTAADEVNRLRQLRARLPKVIDLSPRAGDETPDLDFSRLAVCDPDAPLRIYRVSAVAASQALSGGTLIYHRFKPNAWPANGRVSERWQAVHDPTALLYVRDSDLDGRKVRPGRKIEPLILRANAGDCIELQLTNRLPRRLVEAPGYNTLPNLVQGFNFNQLRSTTDVGLHVQALRYHPAESDGMNAGLNPVQTIAPGAATVYRWYAGRLVESGGAVTYEPVEFGALNLAPADGVKQHSKGLLGALVIEPQFAIWASTPTPPEPHTTGTPLTTRANARVLAFEPATPSTLDPKSWQVFRDLVLVGQNDANFQLRYSTARRWPWPFGGTTANRPVRRVSRAMDCVGGATCSEAEVPREEIDSVDSGHKAFNYRSEAPWMRAVWPAAMPLSSTLQSLQASLLSDQLVGAPNQTPRFCVEPGTSVRVRTAFPGGHGRNHTLTISGHAWPELPFRLGSTRLGPKPLTTVRGSQDGIGPGSNYNLLFPATRLEGDYLIRDMYSWGFDGGLWAVLDVTTKCGQ